MRDCESIDVRLRVDCTLYSGKGARVASCYATTWAHRSRMDIATSSYPYTCRCPTYQGDCDGMGDEEVHSNEVVHS